MGGFSVQCDCGAWFLYRSSYKDHCKSKNHTYHNTRVGPKPNYDSMIKEMIKENDNNIKENKIQSELSSNIKEE